MIILWALFWANHARGSAFLVCDIFVLVAQPFCFVVPGLVASYKFHLCFFAQGMPLDPGQCDNLVHCKWFGGGVPSSVVVSSPSQPAEDHAAAAGAPTRAANHEISGRFHPPSCPNLPWIGPNSEQALRFKHVPCLHSPRQNHTKLRVSQQPEYRVDPGKEAGNAAANVPGPLPAASDQDLRREPWVTCEIHSKIHSSTCTRAPSPSVLASQRQDQIENGPGGPTFCGLTPSPLSMAPRRMPWP